MGVKDINHRRGGMWLLIKQSRVPPTKPYCSRCIMYARERQDEYIVNTLTQRKESSKNKKRRHKTIHGKLVCKNFNQKKKLRINLRAPFYEKQKPMMDLKRWQNR